MKNHKNLLIILLALTQGVFANDIIRNNPLNDIEFGCTTEIITGIEFPYNYERVNSEDCNKKEEGIIWPLDSTPGCISISDKNHDKNLAKIIICENAKEADKINFVDKITNKPVKINAEFSDIKKQTIVDLGEPYGKVYLIDEIDCSKIQPDRPFAQYPEKACEIQNILGEKCRSIAPVKGAASYFTYRIGQNKNLIPGGRYLLVVNYPEDKPRTQIIINTGAESLQAMQSGLSVGDAFHAKYVDGLNESLNIPLTRKWEQWTQLFMLHDRFVKYNKLARGDMPRELVPKDGFNVIIAQFSKKNAPLSAGIAVSKISLYAVPEHKSFTQKINYPPKNLPRRHIFWREEMADGVLGGDQKSKKPLTDKTNIGWGVANDLDWYKYKAERMKFLGINTFTKDLLEFGANQGWDSTPYGGRDWVYQSNRNQLWHNIVKLMSSYGFDLFPYYEYAGSKGVHGLGSERRCKPLNRKSGDYTHVKWIESANADITDPETYTDFKKILDLTVINEKNNGKFAGIWLRPRKQWPVSFSDATLQRFIDEKNYGQKIIRKDLIEDKEAYKKYIKWWNSKRKEFLVAMHQYLLDNGIKNPIVLFTGEPSEPGCTFVNNLKPAMVTNSPQLWGKILKQPEHIGNKGIIQIYSEKKVVDKDLYLQALLAHGIDWGGYEVRHARPSDDPENYKDTDGILMSHAFNRRYTVLSPKTFETYREPAGLAIVRHYSLNENMLVDKKGKSLLGYFCENVERVGPYSMMSEVIAMAHGNPTMIGYLSGVDFHRGFAKYVRNFNSAFLSLPALPGEPLDNGCKDKKITVVQIKTPADGTYIYATNLSYDNKNVKIHLPIGRKYFDAISGEEIKTKNGKVNIKMYPYQMKTFLVK